MLGMRAGASWLGARKQMTRNTQLYISWWKSMRLVLPDDAAGMLPPREPRAILTLQLQDLVFNPDASTLRV